MDFLDPRRKKAHKQRLFLGYFLMSIAILLGTVLVMHLAFGFDVDRKTGELVQNGTLYVDSKPKGAKVFINNIEQRGRTDTRLVLPAGAYALRIEASGYRNWEKTIDLDGGEIERITYPYLVPNEFVTTDVVTYASQPVISTQSPDRRWLLTMSAYMDLTFDVVDLSDVKKAPTQLVVPTSLFVGGFGANDTLEVVEWSTNNRNILMKWIGQDQTRFIVLDREDPAQSIDINTVFGISPVVVSLKNKRSDQFYYMEAVPGVLRVANSKNKTISAPILEQVIDYKTYGDDIVLFATKKDVDAGRAKYVIYDGSQAYDLKNVAESDYYPMDVSKYDNEWYYVIGARYEGNTFVYKNPLKYLKSDTHESVNVEAIIRLANPRYISFSANTQFIGVQGGSEIMSFDLEKEHYYRVKLKVGVPEDYQVRWMDGRRYVYSVAGQSYILDYDGSNEQTLVSSDYEAGPFFDRDYDNVFTIEDSKSTAGQKALTMTVIDNS
ncbi:PEGA domain-containing protein [Candidatus Saccharibacteria bacterium]|nr:PEGA domain-containing protein [Candidatus Saccharibacteria bacterium]